MGLFDALKGIVDEMPTPILESYNAIINGVAAMLGESPEAWRGAIALGMEVMKGLSSYHTEEPDATSPIDHFMMIVIIGLMDKPWGRKALDDLRGAQQQRMGEMLRDVMGDIFGGGEL
jgi:hypothetical protein